MSPNKELWVEEVANHYLQGATIKEIAVVLPGSQENKLVAIVVPDLDHFRQTGETDIHGEVGWEMEYYSQQLPPDKRIGDFVLTNQDLPQWEKIESHEAAALYRQLAGKGTQNRRPARAEAGLSAFGERVVRMLQEKTGSDLIALEDYLGPDLGLDSLALVELLAGLEESFGIQIAEEEFVGILTVGELLRFIEAKKPCRAQQEPAEPELSWGRILQAPPPPASLETIAAAEDPKGRFLNLGAYLGLRFLFKMAFSLRIYGRKRLGPGNYILCPNHGSFLDGFIVFAAVPQVLRSHTYFLGYNNYFAGPVIKNIATWMHVVPVNSARHLIPAMQTAAYILNQGGVLVLFPEGARTLTGELRPFKQGVAVLAKELNLPLVPVYIHESFQAWGPNARFPRPHPIQIIFGQEFSADRLAARGEKIKPGVGTYEAITLGLHQEVLNLKDELQARTSSKST